LIYVVSSVPVRPSWAKTLPLDLPTCAHPIAEHSSTDHPCPSSLMPAWHMRGILQEDAEAHHRMTIALVSFVVHHHDDMWYKYTRVAAMPPGQCGRQLDLNFSIYRCCSLSGAD
jgi:hypothetical protein